MTAHDLIYSIFKRPAWLGMAGNMRRLTRAQLVYLRDLIDEEEKERSEYGEGLSVTRGAPGSLVWMPSGRHKYVIVVG